MRALPIPCIKPQNLGANGAKVAVHRYWAPTTGSLHEVNDGAIHRHGVAYMAAISAREQATAVAPKPTKMHP